MPDPEKVAASLTKAIAKHAKMCADFERMGTAEFRRNYPDYRLNHHTGYGPEGVHYITRKATALAERAEHLLKGNPDNGDLA